ncbi:hypothetical protein D9M69_600070 [compost metagenome]
MHDEQLQGAVFVLREHEGAHDRGLELAAQHRANRLGRGERLERDVAQLVVEDERAVDREGLGLLGLRLLLLQDATADEVRQGAFHIGRVELRAMGQLAGRQGLVGRGVGDHQELLHLGGEKKICCTHFAVLNFSTSVGVSTSGLHYRERPASRAMRLSPRRFRGGFRHRAWCRPTAEPGAHR